MTLLVVLAAVFFAFNIGANNSAAEMGTAYGAGARTKKEALVLVAVFAFLGAVFQGREVILTVGTKLVDPKALGGELYVPLAIIAIAGSSVFVANRFGIPVATTQAVVCAMAASGIIFHGIRWDLLLRIIVWWMVSPICAGILSYIAGRYVYFRFLNWLTNFRTEQQIHQTMSVLLTASGCFVAFTAGANNAANSAGPLVALNMMALLPAALLAGASMSFGAIWMGGRLLETTGKGITQLCATRAVFIELITATMIFVANIFGVPVSFAQTVTGALIGLGFAQKEKQSAEQKMQVQKILAFWALLPISVFVLALGVLKVLSWG